MVAPSKLKVAKDAREYVVRRGMCVGRVVRSVNLVGGAGWRVRSQAKEKGRLRLVGDGLSQKAGVGFRA